MHASTRSHRSFGIPKHSYFMQICGVLFHKNFLALATQVLQNSDCSDGSDKPSSFGDGPDARHSFRESQIGTHFCLSSWINIGLAPSFNFDCSRILSRSLGYTTTWWRRAVGPRCCFNRAHRHGNSGPGISTWLIASHSCQMNWAFLTGPTRWNGLYAAAHLCGPVALWCEMYIFSVPFISWIPPV